MPCYSLAVIQARLTPEVAATILASERAVEALRRFIETQVPARPVTATCLDWGGGMVRITAGILRVDISSSAITVTGARTGPSFGGGIRAITEAIEVQAGRLAVALATEQTATVLRSRYVVTSDQTLPSGARVMRVSI